MVIEFLITL